MSCKDLKKATFKRGNRALAQSVPLDGEDSADVAQLMRYGRKQRLAVGAFAVVTDNETWADRQHMVQALARYSRADQSRGASRRNALLRDSRTCGARQRGARARHRRVRYGCTADRSVPPGGHEQSGDIRGTSPDALRATADELRGRRGWQTRMAEMLRVGGSTVGCWRPGATHVPGPAEVALDCS